MTTIIKRLKGNSILKKSKKFVFIGIVASILLFSPNKASAEKKLKIAVIPFSNLSGKSENDWVGVGFSETMVTSLTNLKNIQVTERFLMNQVLKEVAFQQSGLIDEKSLVKVGKLTGANIIISGTFQIVNGEIVVNSRFIDLEKGIVENGSAFYIRGELNKIFDLEEKLAQSFNEKFSLIPTEQESKSIKASIYATKSIEANKLYLQARYRYMNGAYDGKKEAIELLKESIKIDPNYVQALALLGEVEVEYYNASKMFDMIFRTNKKFDTYYKEGLTHIKSALHIAPDSYEVNRSMAKVLLSEKKEEEAKVYLAKALTLKPDDVESILLEGKIDKEHKLDYINKAFKIDNFNYEVYFELGKNYLYGEKVEPEKAIENLLKAIELNPNSWPANMQIVQAYIRNKDFKSALAWADRMLLMEKDRITYMVVASVYVGVGDFKKLKELYIEIDKMEDSPFVKSILAGMYLKDKEYENAFELLKRGLKNSPNDPFLNQLISIVYLEYYNNCRFALYHHNLYIKNLDKVFLPEEILKKQKVEAEKTLKDINTKCGS